MSSTDERCNECGAIVPHVLPMVNSLHDESCSLHPSAVVTETPQEASGGAKGSYPTGPVTDRPVADRAGARPWRLEVGWDGGLTAIVDGAGYLVADVEHPDTPYMHPSERGPAQGESAANAALIVAAVNAYTPKVSTRAAVELATVRETRTE